MRDVEDQWPHPCRYILSLLFAAPAVHGICLLKRAQLSSIPRCCLSLFISQLNCPLLSIGLVGCDTMSPRRTTSLPLLHAAAAASSLSLSHTVTRTLSLSSTALCVD